MLIIMVLFLFAVTAIHQYLTVLKYAGIRLRIIHTGIMLISFCLLILYVLNVPLPSPNNLIIDTVNFIFKINK